MVVGELSMLQDYRLAVKSDYIRVDAYLYPDRASLRMELSRLLLFGEYRFVVGCSGYKRLLAGGLQTGCHLVWTLPRAYLVFSSCYALEESSLRLARYCLVILTTN